MSTTANKPGKKFILSWGITVLLPLAAFLYCSSSPSINQQQAAFFTITITGLCIWALGLLPDALVAMTLPVAYIVANLGTPRQLLVDWAQPTGWVMLGGLVVTVLMMQTGLANRLAVKALSVSRGSFIRLLFGIALASFLIAPVIPTLLGKVALICAICVGICEAMGLEKKSREACAVMLAGLIGTTGSKFGFLTGGGDVLLLTSLITSTMQNVDPSFTISWGTYFIQNFVPCVIYTLLSMLILIAVLRPKVTGDFQAFVEKQAAEIGPLRGDELKTAIFLVILIIALVTDSWHHINPGWLMILMVFVLALPGVGVLTEKRLASVNLLPVFFVVGCMGIGSAATATGVDQQLTNALMPYFQGSGELGTMIIGYLTGAAVNFLLTPMAAISSMSTPLTTLVLELGHAPLPILYSFLYGLDQYLFPYEFAAVLYFYATGWISLPTLMKVLIVKFFVTIIFLLGICYPWWKLTGVF